MKIEKIKGIIIKDINYKESSKVLHILTKEYGTIGVISKGCRNIKSKLRSVSLKLTYGYFYISYKEDGLSTLIEADVIDELKNIKTNFSRIGYLSYLVDLTSQVIKETNNYDLFDIMEFAIIKINNLFDPMIITNIVELKFLEYLGVKPILDYCSICGSKNEIMTISSDSGGYACQNCYTNEYITDIKTIKLLRMFYYVDISKIKELNILDKNKYEINKFLEGYYEKYTGLYLKSKEFLNKMIN